MASCTMASCTSRMKLDVVVVLVASLFVLLGQTSAQYSYRWLFYKHGIPWN